VSLGIQVGQGRMQPAVFILALDRFLHDD